MHVISCNERYTSLVVYLKQAFSCFFLYIHSVILYLKKKKAAKREADAIVNSYKRQRIDTTDDKSIDVYADDSAEEKAEEATEAPVEESASEEVAEPVAEVVEETAETPVEEPVAEPATEAEQEEKTE